MSWLILLFAGLLEVLWAVGLKYTDGFSKPLPSFVTVAAMLTSLYFLSLALRTLPLGTAYAIWVGVGMVGAVIVGVVIFHETLSVLKIFSLLMVVAGIAGLKLSSIT